MIVRAQRYTCYLDDSNCSPSAGGGVYQFHLCHPALRVANEKTIGRRFFIIAKYWRPARRVFGLRAKFVRKNGKRE